MILIEFLFAPTVPSEPRPKNLHSIVPCGTTEISSFMESDWKVTSSTIPTEKPSLGSFIFRLS